jgi:hypothetical protein
MNPLSPHLVRLGVCLGTTVLLVGCSGGLGTVSQPGALSARARASLTSPIAVASPATAAVTTRFDAPTGRTGLTEGLAVFDQFGRSGGDALASALYFPAVLAITPVVNSFRTTPADDLRHAESDLSAGLTLAARTLQRDFARLFLEAAAPTQRARFAAPVRTSGAEPAAQSPVVLELTLRELALRRSGTGDTAYSLTVTARIRLVQTADGSLLHDDELQFHSGQAKLADWSDRRTDAVGRTAAYGLRQISERFLASLGPALAGVSSLAESQSAGAAMKTSSPANPTSFTPQT